MSSTAYVSIAPSIQEEFSSSTQVTALVQSLLSLEMPWDHCVSDRSRMFTLFEQRSNFRDISGRRWVYAGSCFLLAALSVGCYIPRGVAQVIIFSFLSGVAGSATVTNAAASVSDMFGHEEAGQAMALIVVGNTAGPSIANPVGYIFVENFGYHWWYYTKYLLDYMMHVLMVKHYYRCCIRGSSCTSS